MSQDDERCKPETCPVCACRSLVINSRPQLSSRHRRRKCVICGHRWNTYESLIDPDEIPPSLMARLVS